MKNYLITKDVKNDSSTSFQEENECGHNDEHDCSS